jgi:hypothetical protein
VINGTMIGGFALVAWPVDYGNSGIVPFMVNHQGSVHQRDLGPDTAKSVRTLNADNPDSAWRRPSN